MVAMEKRIEILAMEDDPLMVRFLGIVLQKLDIAFHHAMTGHEGVELFKQKSDQIMLVLLDLSLADQSWSKTVDELLAIRSDIKIVISSGSIVEDEGHQNDPRIFDHLPKPFSIPDLQKLVQRVINE